MPTRRVHLHFLPLLFTRTLHVLLNNHLLLQYLFVLDLILQGLDSPLQFEQNIDLSRLGRGFSNRLSQIRAQLIDYQMLHEVLIPLHELELLWGLCPCAARMVGNSRNICIFLTFVGREGREELGDGLYFWEVLVDFCVFEEVVEEDQ